jgi:hypothetical protein
VLLELIKPDLLRGSPLIVTVKIFDMVVPMGIYNRFVLHSKVMPLCKCIYNIYRNSAEKKIKKIRRPTICQIAHFKFLATYSAHTENVKAFIQSI